MPIGLPMVLAVLHDIAHAYDRWIVDTGKQPELLLLLSFLASFGFIRTSAHMIRAQVRWWPGNVEMGGTHVHHLVWGILLMLVVGYCAIAFAPGAPVREVFAVLFGIGAGLTLDEFALWLNLKDVYWSDKGRRSIDAVIVAGTCAALVLFGLRVWIDLADEVALGLRLGAAAFGSVALAIALVNVLKGKYVTAAAGLVLPLVGPLGALRLAKPRSLWAHRYDARKRARAEARFPPRRGGRTPASQPSV